MDEYQPVSTTDNEGDATEEGGDAGGGEVHVHYGGGEEVHISQKGKMKGRAAQGGGTAGGGEEAFKQELLTAVEEGDEHRLRSALRHLSNKKAIDEALALNLAAKNNSPKLVTALLDAGADPNIQDYPWKKYCPLHYAAKNGCVEVVKALLEKDANPNAKEREFSNTALHLLTNNWKTNEDSYKACLDALLSYDKTHVDILNTENQSPIFLAVSSDWEYMVKRLIYKGANTKATYANETIEDLIKTKFPDLLPSINTNDIVELQRHLSEDLNSALIRRNIELFREILDKIKEDELQSVLKEDHGEHTLLTYACEKGLTVFVKELLKRGADPSQENQTNKMNPILYAARNGLYKILALLLLALRDPDDQNTDCSKVRDALKKTDDRGETALHKVVKREYDNKEEGVDYSKCLDLLLDKKQLLDLDVKVELGYTEDQSQDPDVQNKCKNKENTSIDMDEQEKFMDKEKCLVDLDAQDKYGFTALHHAVHFDDQSFVRELLLSGANLTIKNDFGTWAITRIQPLVLKEVLNDCIKYRNNVLNSDIEIIFHYSILEPKQGSQQTEMECLKFLSDSNKYQHLLKHPVISTFLHLKWQRIEKYYYLNILLYTAFLILLTAYILLFHGTFTPSTDADPNRQKATAETGIQDLIKENMALKISLQVLISICTLYLAVKEVIQFSISFSRKQYMMNFKNWLEILIVLLTCTVLFIPMEVVPQQSVCAWLVLFSWIEFVLLLGRHPYLSIYITMFTTVTNNFLKFIIMFSSMVVAFSISFYLVFQVDEHFNTTDFTIYHNSLLKTIAMTTGELEYTGLPLDAFPISSHLLYVAFVFLIVIVLMNLLNGLAVSDIQQIREEAEITSYICRVEVVSYIESVFLIIPLPQILKRLLQCCKSSEDSSSKDNSKQYNPARQLLNCLDCSTIVFQTCLSSKESTPVFPNKDKEQWYICKCHCFQLQEAQIEAAKNVVLEKEHITDHHRLTGIESRLNQLTAAVLSFTNKEKVDKPVNCPFPQ